ncbi:glycosyltransferase [Trichocoleus sp. Lan]|uniref:glycosyltransferase family 4 protein n=1 Tax=Trichocoleus sp. Lan TaxID=2933927 RepID=UPI00329809C9
MVNWAAKSTRRLCIAFIITGLGTGGAEMMLYKLLSRINREEFNPVLISLMDRGTLGERIAALDIPVHTIGMQHGIPTLASIGRLIRTVRQIKPHLIQGWMSHGNLAAQLVNIFLPGQVPVAWNIRHSALSLSDTKVKTILIIKILSYLSYFPKRVIYACKVGADEHYKIGYCNKKNIIISNGFDTELFTPSLEARATVRLELNLAEESFMIGLVGRFHPMKDHENFLKAAALLVKIKPDVKFVLAGQGVDWQNQLLCRLIQELGIYPYVHLLGERQDVPRLTAALDIASCSSYCEGFPNVIGEAMSCGVPCVVTDVGDAAWIVGETGCVVPPSNPEALSRGWLQLMEIGAKGRYELGRKARERIKEKFSLESIVKQYEETYKQVIYG